ncbi:MAG: DNA replication/repair protein RecF [Oscillospiraceae bacterium]|nr:DNA replication/repair protein RecF [Oscillospiraceae bacterium]
MKAARISLTNFRSYAQAEAAFADGINVICGPNAQGKTNLLEAVYMLAGARSFRTRFDREMIAFDADAAAIEAEIWAEGREQKLSIALRRGVKKQIKLNGVRRTGTELCESIRAVLFSPDDLGLIKDGAAARRRLMDMAITQLRPGYAKALSDFNRLYENKSRILRDHLGDRAMMSALGDFSDGLCRASARLIRYRASFAAALGELASPIHREFSGSGEELEVRYKTVSTVTDPSAPAEVIYSQLLEHLAAHEAAELASGQCLTGAHKDDLEIFINGRSARSFASQGQTRTAALSLKLAEREIFLRDTGEYPILLLDDVLSELDGARREFVLNRIGGGQTLITCCENEQIVRQTGGKVFFVEKGSVREGT